MSAASNPPMPNPRQSNGFLVTVSLPSLVIAARLRRGDVFALPENPNEHLKIETIAPHPELGSRLIIIPTDETTQFTLHVDEPVEPVSMPRTVQVTCQLCGTDTTTALDLVTQGEPKTWVCNRH
ncbi:hypothetical protein G3I77_02285 [Streptomyces sp. D2-8]|uniref:hypothetical protein n=1 Tax=Streptomyces sp. D2-8 TaxID=2707767 RepID=UPI0020BF4CC7|nr:hypothetical protein [Streptomyces sp. D2-8]MCK8431892.1 hypothetical protein [Streptomyces sp. D2-8]